MGLWQTAQGICCNTHICCPWHRSWFLENHRGVCQAGQGGVQPMLPQTLLWDPEERHMAAGAEEGDRGILAVAWQGKCLNKGIERSWSCCGSGGASALPGGDSRGSSKGSYSQAGPQFVPCIPRIVPSLTPDSPWAAGDSHAGSSRQVWGCGTTGCHQHCVPVGHIGLGTAVSGLARHSEVTFPYPPWKGFDFVFPLLIS